MEIKLNEPLDEPTIVRHNLTTREALSFYWPEDFLDCFNVKTDYINDPNGKVILEWKKMTKNQA